MWWFEVFSHCREDYNPVPQIWYLDAHYVSIYCFLSLLLLMCFTDTAEIHYFKPAWFCNSLFQLCKHYKTLQKFVAEGGQKQLSLCHHYRALQVVKTSKKAAEMGQIHHTWFMFLFSLSNSSWWSTTLCFCMHFIRLCMCVWHPFFSLKGKASNLPRRQREAEFVRLLIPWAWHSGHCLEESWPLSTTECHCFLKVKILPILVS